MKKVYAKPKMEVVRFEVNEAIASCGALMFNLNDASCYDESNYGNWTDLAKSFYDKGNNFVSDMGCTIPVQGYCYYTSGDATGNSLLMNS